MEKNTEIRYSESGLSELEKFQKSQTKKLEEEIVKSKYFPGTDYIEVTANDIKEAERKFKVISRGKSEMLYTLIITYLTAGVLMFFGGIFYEEILSIVKDNSTKGMFILLGLVMSIFSTYMYLLIRQRERKNKQKIENIIAVDRQIEKQTILDHERLDELRRQLIKEIEEKLKEVKSK